VKIWPVFKKEMRLYATSPIAYVVFFIFLAVMGWFFYQILSYFSMASMRSAMNPQMARDLNVTDSVMRPLFGNLSVILVLALMPFITMRLLAEERQTGTIELLLTYPLRDWEVLLGKYLAVLGLYTMLLVLTLLYPLTLAYFARIEWGTVLSGYIGMFLMGSAFLAVGLFASSITASQIVAAAWTFGILLLLWVVGWGADSVGGTWGKVLQHLSTMEHNDNFAKGVLDTKDVLYYVNLTLLALFLAYRSLETRRWKG